MEWSKKLLLVGSLFLVALAVLDDKHGVHSKSIRMNQRYTVNPSEEKVVVDAPPAPVYNKFYLVHQWAGTVCKLNSCTRKPNMFTIHGLWPQNTSPWPRTNCCGGLQDKKCEYNTTLISTIRGELDKSWPSLLYTSNDRFWAHEWTAHGACAVDEIAQLNYFEKANELFNKHSNFFNILESADFKANDSIYCVNDMKEAIKKATKLNVVMVCDALNSTDYLKEIRVCVDKKATKVESCSASTPDKCKPLAKFPPI